MWALLSILKRPQRCVDCGANVKAFYFRENKRAVAVAAMVFIAVAVIYGAKVMH